MKFRAFIFLSLVSLFFLMCSFNIWAKHPSLHHPKNLETSQRKSLNHPLRLSNKGDLSTSCDNIKRRRFYMKGDGNCFFWAIGLTQKQAVNIWLKYANNPLIRKMGCEDIYQHAFVERKSDFALTLQNDPSYIKLISDSNNFFSKLEQSYLANNMPLLPELDPLALAREGEYLYNRKMLYCQGEAIYRNYVKHHLSRNGQWMSIFYGPCFANILAFDQKKNLVVFHYDNNDHPQKLIAGMHYTHPQTTKET
ncbi:MAG: hypothetical protein K2P93_03195 [Alphaproteobacteria bacterium]|nr:hypothetical protein [Alphaproteobacteria bacterium]